MGSARSIAAAKPDASGSCNWPSMSTSGPNGRGVVSASHQPRNTRARPFRSAMNRSMTAVLPTPASPRSNTTRPAPLLARRHMASSPFITPSRSNSNCTTPGLSCCHASDHLPERLSAVSLNGRKYREDSPCLRPICPRRLHSSVRGWLERKPAKRKAGKCAVETPSCQSAAGSGRNGDEAQQVYRPGWRIGRRVGHRGRTGRNAVGGIC